MNTETTGWLAAHLYFAEPWEIFLTQAVQPFAEQVLREQLSDQYFFIRYWEKGPHIRLRFRGIAPQLEHNLKPLLITCFRDYFLRHPSRRTEPGWLTPLSAGQSWYPNDTVQFIAYEPEVDRYGGERGITIAEQQFLASSRAVLNAIGASQGWNYERALGVGIQLHLGMLYQLGLAKAEACQFLQQVFSRWLPRAYSHLNETSPGELQQRKEEVLRAFAKAYTRQKKQILSVVGTVWESLEQGFTFGQQWFQQWLDDMQMIARQLAQCQRDNQLRLPATYRVNKETDISSQEQGLWVLYDSYVHMTNNRLGILNRDEGYLGYLLLKALEEL